MVSFSPEGHGRKDEPMKENGHVPFKPGSTPMQPGETPKPRSIEESIASVHAHANIKKIKKLLRKNPPLGKDITAERDRRLGEHE